MTPRRLTQATVDIIVKYPTLMLNVLLLALVVAVFAAPAASNGPLELNWRPATADEIHKYEVDQLVDFMENQRQNQTP